ncbi:MAG: antibiotic biosynthesis monooxygenase [Spirosomaceae bacterium]|nr:antibiotic biosynthesis monooxygenase [Spirosomataceae bacterium]
MLIRIVRMTFQPDKVADFLAIFEASKHKIRAVAGCQQLQLLRDTDTPNVLMTYSLWTHADALEAYRASALFQSTWAQTKVLFADKPVAFSSESLWKSD